MYGFPSSFDTSLFVGKPLEQLCFTENTLTLHFANGPSVVVESAIAVSMLGREPERRVHEIPIKTSSLMELLGRVVSQVRVVDAGTLCLLFDSGLVLEIIENSKQYECYSIRYDGKSVVV
jgi:hypothetical protein